MPIVFTSRWTLLALVAAIVAPLAFAPRAAAQSARLTVRVRVLDTADHPIAGADIDVKRGLRQFLAQGQTDAAGTRTLTVTRVNGEFEVTARKLGYAPANQFVTASDDPTVDVTLRLHQTVQTLAPVAVTAEEDALRKRNYIDAAAIAASSRPILDGLDVISKLRPSMIDPPDNSEFDPCGLFNLWVNGTRVMLPPETIKVDDQMVASRVKTMSPAPRGWIAEALSKIKPEHIAEITYKGCHDKLVDANGGNNAAFVVLKEGIGYNLKDGSYFITEDKSVAGRVAHAARIRGDTLARPIPPMAAYRYRLLGVYDESTGDPIAEAAVVDTLSGTAARTTPTGTVSLVFLPDGISTIRIEKPGYAALLLDVKISPTDTVPLTLTLGKPK